MTRKEEKKFKELAEKIKKAVKIWRKKRNI